MDTTKEKFLDALKFGECSRCDGIAAEPHPCPFALEIHGDKSECSCCDECAGQCAMDI